MREPAGDISNLSCSYLILIYSYRAKNNGLLAILFLSSLEMLPNDLMLSSSKFLCGFSVLIEADLDGFSLRVFSS